MPLLLAALVLFFALLAATSAYALRKGGKDERQGIVALLMAVLLTQVAAQWGPGWNGPEIGVMIVDAALFIAFVAIAYRSRKFWPIWAAASQLVAVLTHWVVILNPSIVRTVYATAQPFWVFPVIIAIALGTRAHQRSLR
jgi:hypothetical protein